MGTRAAVKCATILAACALAANACTAHGHGDPPPKPLRKLTFTVDRPTASVYQPIDVQLSGLKPAGHVTITSTATDSQGRTWRGRAGYVADASGVVDLVKQPSVQGTYTGVDQMGLFWSMNPPDGIVAAKYRPEQPRQFAVTLTASADSASGTTTLIRQITAPGVTIQHLNLARDKVYGTLFLPGSGPTANTRPRPAVVLFGGSEGGESQDVTAAALASEGFPALSIAYFQAPGLPQELVDIPLGYFEQAATDLSNQPGVDRDHILVLGGSRGSEAALLAAQFFPQVIHGAIVYSPSAVVVSSYPSGRSNAWSFRGQPVLTGDTIPVDHIAGPVLAFAGAADQLWRDAGASATQIDAELSDARSAFPHKASVYPAAGHGVFGEVGLPAFTQVRDLGTGQLLDLGGTRQANAAAQQSAWSDVLSLLRSLS